MKRLRPYFRYLRAVRGPFAAALASAIVYGVVSGFVINYYIFKEMLPRIFDRAAAPLTTGALLGYAALIPATFLVRGLAGYANTYLVNLCGVRILEALRLDFFQKLQVLPLTFFHKNPTGDLISRGLADTNQLQFTITNVANELFKQPATLIGAVGYLTWLAWGDHDVLLLLLCLGSIPLCVFPIRYVGKHLLRRARQTQAEMGSLTDRLSENLGALKEVRAFGLEARETGRFAQTVRQLFTYQMKMVKYSSFLTPAIEVLSAFGIAATLLYAYHARMDWGTFISILGALYMSYDPIKRLGGVNNDLKKGLSALDRLEVIFHAPVTITDPAHPAAVGRLRGDLVFDRVTFAYGDTPALRGVSATIPAGAVCALVGPSGAGKTTFANLVPRFYEAGGGAVTIDGLDVRAMRLADLRRNLALVSQDPVLFNDTIYHNLLLGRADATRDEVFAAARDAFADDFIRALPLGYDTIVGERGALISGGQKQRLALARAFLRNAPLLILDEATSALDSESEAAIQQALRKLVVGKTTLIIAHRFSTIRDATLILVFDRGKIVATGNHGELHASNMLYRSLYDRQSITASAPLPVR